MLREFRIRSTESGIPATRSLRKSRREGFEGAKHYWNGLPDLSQVEGRFHRWDGRPRPSFSPLL